MAKGLQDKRIALVATHGVEQGALTEPWKAVESEGGQPELISLESGEIQGFDHLDKDQTFTVDRTVAEARHDDYDKLVEEFCEGRHEEQALQTAGANG